MKKGKIGTYIKMLSVLCFVRIETEWITFICAIRTLLIEIIAILGIYYFVNCIKSLVSGKIKMKKIIILEDVLCKNCIQGIYNSIFVFYLKE